MTTLSLRPIARAVIAAFLGAGLSTTVDAKKNCAQGGNEQDGECLVFLGKARVEDSSGSTVAQRSFWLSSNIFDNTNTFFLDASGWTSTPFDLTPGGLRISLSPVVAAGNGGTHRLNLTAGSPDCGKNNGCNIDSQNQTGGFDVVIRPPPAIQPPPIQPPPIQPPPIQPPPVERPPIDMGDIIETLRQNGVAALLDRSYSISDRVVSGLAARRYVGLRAFDLPFAPVMLAEATTDLPPGALGITPQRDLGPSTEWSAWLDASYLDVSDTRYGLSTDGSTRGLILGVDRQVSDVLVVGLAVGTDDADITGYGNTVDVDYRGYYGGPYLGYRIDDDLVLDAWLAYGSYDADSSISILDGSSDFTRWFGSVNLTGQYVYEDYRFRPKLALFYAHDSVDDPEYAIHGIPGLDGYKFIFDGENYNYGLLEASLEVNRLWTVSDDLLVLPYARAGVRYDFDRPNGGELVTPSLELVTPSAWSGNLRLGVKALVNEELIVDASAGYLSLGQNGLDAWNGRLAVSWLF